MSVDKAKILKKLKGEPNRERVSLYLDLKLYKTFQAACEKDGVSASKVMEEMMREYLAAPSPTKEESDILELFGRLDDTARASIIKSAKASLKVSNKS